MIKMIWAQDEDKNIGYQGHIPWNLPADMAFFKKETIGHPIIMGSKTFFSLPKILPKRKHLVLSRHPEKFKKFVNNPQFEVFSSIEEIKEIIYKNPGQDFYVIGGARVYQDFMEIADELFVTQIHHKFVGDVKAPEIDLKQFELTEKKEYLHDQENKYDFDFLKYNRLV